MVTVVLAWVLIVAGFYQKPELLTGAQRWMQRGIEVVGDAIPHPWGPRIVFVFREIGGLIWLQITIVVVALRIALSTIATTWRLILRRDRGHTEASEHNQLANWAGRLKDTEATLIVRYGGHELVPSAQLKPR